MSEIDQNDSNPPGETPVPTISAPVDDGGALSAELESARRHIEKLNKENEKHRKAKQELKARQEEQGEYKALASTLSEEVEALKAQLGEFAGVADKAKAYDALMQSEAEAIAAEAADLPEHLKLAVEAVPDLATKKKIIAGHRATSSQETVSQTKPPHAGGAPAPNTVDETTYEGRKKYREGLQRGRRSSYAPAPR
ncbi:MAG: hypothetical protein ACPG6R_10945 [Aequoribacter sp.]|uniref:hypothetical protein n=1 Tax=Aequoribacter sp. TaxID=2847771 RepID=UPI003C476A94